jgi:uncharacterized protein (TIGR03083 family)
MSAEPVIEHLEAVWADVAALCDGLTDEEWARPTDCPGWTVKDHVSHMIGTERLLLGEQAPPADLSAASHVRNDIGKANEQWIEAYRALPGKEVLDEFRAVTARRLDALRALRDDDWNREGFTPEGPGPYRQFMEIRVFDCWYHDQDIREALGRPGFLEGPVADASLARIPARGLGYVVGKKAAAVPGPTLKSRPKAARACVKTCPPRRRCGSRPTAARSRGWPAAGGAATTPARTAWSGWTAIRSSADASSTRWRSRSDSGWPGLGEFPATDRDVFTFRRLDSVQV